MTGFQPPPPSVGPPLAEGRPMRPWPWALITLAAALLGGGAVYAVMVHPEPAPKPSSVTVVKPTPSVLVSVRSLARLETIEFHMERVIDLTDKQRRLFGLVEAEDSVLLVAAGDVVAGVDLGELLPDDVTSDMAARTARVRLPPPKIFSARLDSQRTYVHTRRTDALAQRKEGLETQARQEAEKRIGEAAIEAGILEKARAPAARTVETLLRSLGFEQVQIEWRER